MNEELPRNSTEFRGSEKAIQQQEADYEEALANRRKKRLAKRIFDLIRKKIGETQEKARLKRELRAERKRLKNIKNAEKT